MSYRINGVVQTQGQAYSDNFLQDLLVHISRQGSKFQLRIFLFDIENAAEPGAVHSNDGGECHAGNAHGDNCNKSKSNTMLMIQDKSKKRKVERLSPKPRRIPAFIL